MFAPTKEKNCLQTARHIPTSPVKAAAIANINMPRISANIIPLQTCEEIRYEASKLKEQILKELKEMIMWNSDTNLSTLKARVAALKTEWTELTELTETIDELADEVQKLDSASERLRSEIGKQAKHLAEVVVEALRTFIKPDFDDEFVSRKDFTSANDVLGFVCSSLKKKAMH
jgi:archaellum component FlaC